MYCVQCVSDCSILRVTIDIYFIGDWLCDSFVVAQNISSGPCRRFHCTAASASQHVPTQIFNQLDGINELVVLFNVI